MVMSISSVGVLTTKNSMVTSYSLRSKLGKARTPINLALGSKFYITSSTFLDKTAAVIGVNGSKRSPLIPEPISG